ncbi:hypothetical protein [Hymenobacter terricola]|uniref:hypothetical protein n=1 Tax=Hymenobacter terricola TaxID=2819236 RepID=UPI001CF54CB9|nr:hypothetical protein [Hymenobacter terricola]
MSDSYGAPLADYYFLPDEDLLYIRWHGHLTGAAVIQGAQKAGQLREQYPYSKVLNDKRDTAGDWSDALPWLQYEWLPAAVAAGLRAMAYILSPDLHAQVVSHEFVEAVGHHLNVELFTAEAEAQRWLQTQ